jgi:hypothetical protein
MDRYVFNDTRVYARANPCVGMSRYNRQRDDTENKHISGRKRENTCICNKKKIYLI